MRKLSWLMSLPLSLALTTAGGCDFLTVSPTDSSMCVLAPDGGMCTPQMLQFSLTEQTWSTSWVQAAIAASSGQVALFTLETDGTLTAGNLNRYAWTEGTAGAFSTTATTYSATNETTTLSRGLALGLQDPLGVDQLLISFYESDNGQSWDNLTACPLPGWPASCPVSAIVPPGLNVGVGGSADESQYKFHLGGLAAAGQIKDGGNTVAYVAYNPPPNNPVVAINCIQNQPMTQGVLIPCSNFNFAALPKLQLQNVSEPDPIYFILHDYNGDNVDDVAVILPSTSSPSINLWLSALNNQTPPTQVGTWTTTPLPLTATLSYLGDLDLTGDGLPDAVLSSTDHKTLFVAPYSSTTGFSSALLQADFPMQMQFPVSSVALVDVLGGNRPQFPSAPAKQLLVVGGSSDQQLNLYLLWPTLSGSTLSVVTGPQLVVTGPPLDLPEDPSGILVGPLAGSMVPPSIVLHSATSLQILTQTSN
jgi:hypothetical protein